MKKSLILSLVLLEALSVNAYCGSHWDEFLSQPDKTALIMLEKSIAARAQHCSWGNPNNKDVAPTEKQNIKLFELIGKGNESAFRAALLISKCLDGGELEDFYRSAGIFFEKRPYVFLQIIQEKTISDLEIRYLLTMLPLDTVDNISKQIFIIENRIKILKNNNDKSLIKIKEKGLSFLENKKEELP